MIRQNRTEPGRASPDLAFSAAGNPGLPGKQSGAFFESFANFLTLGTVIIIYQMILSCCFILSGQSGSRIRLPYFTDKHNLRKDGRFGDAGNRCCNQNLVTDAWNAGEFPARRGRGNRDHSRASAGSD